ncbi:MAG: DUF6036 family nucleotidyltransferase [Actinomycetota bacterium]
MKRAAFDHAIRAAGSVLGETELLVIGSQAVHGSIAGDLPPEAERSIEVDIAAFDDPDARKADLIDGSIGEASMFQETFGYYAEGVTQATAVLPIGWRDRLVRYESPMTDGVVAWCLELHDLWLAKAVAGRPKDYEFCRALTAHELVDKAVLIERLQLVPGLADPVRGNVAALIESAPEQQ